MFRRHRRANQYSKMESNSVCNIFLSFLLFIQNTLSYEVKTYPLSIPNAPINRDELYLCTPVKVVPNKSFYIVGFKPNATMDKVHHMILFGCSNPGTPKPYWDCGQMASDNSQGISRANPCAEGSHVIYAWARNAAPLDLPEDVGFQVGNGTQISYLVLQVHYAKKFPDGGSDNSGINLIYTETPQTKLAGVLLLATGGIIPPHNITHMETDCMITENKEIYPFAYRTHTHGLGKVVSGYQVKQDASKDKWVLLGKRDPLTPQMFYPTLSREPIKTRDIVAARCTMESHRNRDTHVGPTNADEMCNFYLMYYVNHDSPLDLKYCVRAGPPDYYWAKSKKFNFIPDAEASHL